MSEVRAFVAHSFTSSDKELFNPGDEWVVNEFLKFFDEVGKLNRRFSWDHAASAQPLGIGDKVKSIWVDKNLFIAICTKKECVVSGSIITDSTAVGQIAADKIEWKTSDWIIQEIGYAIGRECKLIVLIEYGLRKPGWLQGDLEYIQFDRAAPAKCFTKLLQMISSIVPRERPLPSSIGLTVPEAAGDDEETVGVEEFLKEPAPSWTPETYRISFHFAMLENDTETEGKVERSFLESEYAKDSDSLLAWQAYCESMKVEFGCNGDINKLRVLAKEHPGNCDVIDYLARALSAVALHVESAEAYDSANAAATTNKAKLFFLARAILERIRSGMSEIDLSQKIDELSLLAGSEDVSESERLEAHELIYQELKSDDVLILLWHRLTELKPSNSSKKFSLAYAHESKGNTNLSLYYYVMIPRRDRDSSSWNNLGVIYNELDFKAHSVEAYRKAEDLGETLAMSNIAAKYILEGFIDEAKQICKKAMAKKEYNSNLLLTLAMANELLGKEQGLITNIIISPDILRASRFFSDGGRAICQRNRSELNGRWIGPECELEISVIGDEFTAKGEFDKSGNQLLGGLMPLTASYVQGVLPTPERWRIRFNGIVRGRVILGRVDRSRVGQMTSYLGSLLSSPEVLILVAEDGLSLSVMEKQQSEFRWFDIRRLTPK